MMRLNVEIGECKIRMKRNLIVLTVILSLQLLNICPQYNSINILVDCIMGPKKGEGKFLMLKETLNRLVKLDGVIGYMIIKINGG